MSDVSLPRPWGWLAAALFLAALARVLWLAWFDDNIRFLPSGPAPWIVYPSPLDPSSFPGMELPAEFHRHVTLSETPSRASLEFRCFKSCVIRINGKAVATGSAVRWKTSTRLDVTDALQRGDNDIEASVSTDMGPPASSLKLQLDGMTVLTDESWDVSLAGTSASGARRASEAPEPGPGNPLSGAERTRDALRNNYGKGLLWLAISVVACLIGRRASMSDGVARNLILMLLAAPWIFLLLHNLSCRVATYGFDAVAHLGYIEYIRTKHSLPLATQGAEMYQAPLYYIVSSGLLSLFDRAAASDQGLLILRLFNVAVGAANVALVYVGLGFVFPAQWKRQAAGAALAAFAPWHLYLLHYPTNEVLSAMLGTASIVLCLKCLHTDAASARCLALGAVLGAGCLTKASSLALLPVILAALAGKLSMRSDCSPIARVGRLASVVGLAVAISGWHYWRLWRQYGNPLAGNWDPAIVHAWWQQPGYFTLAYFTSYGRSLTAPFFSGFHSFWDALYSTLWGDGLWGGWTQVPGRPPWHYELMAAGYVLALVPTLVVVCGCCVAVVRFVREPRVDWLLLVGSLGVMFLAIVLLSLRLPSYEQPKAFHALNILLPFCACAIVGYEYLTRHLGSIGRFALSSLLGVWLVNTYATFWIDLDSPKTRLAVAVARSLNGEDQTAEVERILASDPHNRVAQLELARLDWRAGRMARFTAGVRQAFGDHPEDGEICLLAAETFARENDWESALQLAQRAARLAPENVAVTLTGLRFASQRPSAAVGAGVENDVIAAAQLVLHARPTNAEAHRAMGDALLQIGQTDAAAMHLKLAANRGH